MSASSRRRSQTTMTQHTRAISECRSYEDKCEKNDIEQQRLEIHRLREAVKCIPEIHDNAQKSRNELISIDQTLRNMEEDRKYESCSDSDFVLREKKYYRPAATDPPNCTQADIVKLEDATPQETLSLSTPTPKKKKRRRKKEKESPSKKSNKSRSAEEDAKSPRSPKTPELKSHPRDWPSNFQGCKE